VNLRFYRVRVSVNASYVWSISPAKRSLTGSSGFGNLAAICAATSLAPFHRSVQHSLYPCWPTRLLVFGCQGAVVSCRASDWRRPCRCYDE